MIDYITQWLGRKWNLDTKPDDLLHHYDMAFNSAPGQAVMQDLIDKFFFVDGVDNVNAERHLGRQDVVMAILRNVDLARNPQKYGKSREV